MGVGEDGRPTMTDDPVGSGLRYAVAQTLGSAAALILRARTTLVRLASPGSRRPGSRRRSLGRPTTCGA